MRGVDERTGELFSYVDLEARVRADHPLRAIRTIVNEALSALEHEFAALYARVGRPSIPPEKLIRAMLLQAFYSIRLRTTANGAPRIRSPVPVVRRAWGR
jgi:transposase